MTATDAATSAAKPLSAWPAIPWPAGTGFYILRTWLALSLALYLAFLLELDSASSAGVCVMLLAQPAQGMVLSKAIYRTAGTLAGVVVAVSITALFPQDRTMTLAAFTLWIGVCTAVATLLRDFRAYGTVLAGYTVAIISIANIDTPTATFGAAINRVAAILVGIFAIAIVNALMGGAQSSRSLFWKLRHATRETIAMARVALDRREPPDPMACVAMSATFMPLRSEIGFASPEHPDGARRSEGARSALLGLFEMLSAIQAVGVGLKVVGPPTPVLEKAIAIVRRALPLQRPERLLPALDSLASEGLAAGTLSLEETFALDRMHLLIATLGDVRDGLHSVRDGRAPRRLASVPVHQDYLSVFLNFLRVVVTVGTLSALGVWSGFPATASAILFTAVYMALGSLTPNPNAMGFSAVVGLPATLAIACVYQFLIFPLIDGYPLFAVSLIPIVFTACYLQMIGSQGFGAIVGTMAMVIIAPSNPQTLDPATFVSDGLIYILAGILIFVSFHLVLPVWPAQRRLRLALAVGTNLRNALADEKRLQQPRASLQYDRLSQFKQWLGDGSPSLARRKTLMRLNDIGNLAYAVRRSWRALDAASAFVPLDLDARARASLPTLSPDETRGVAREYIAAAVGRDAASARALTHAAAALYGTALVTTKEARLLRRVDLLRRVV